MHQKLTAAARIVLGLLFFVFGLNGFLQFIPVPADAMSEAMMGLMNGFAFALLTTPSLIIAMHAFNFFKNLKKYYQTILGLSSVLVGLLACCRGFAEMGVIPHFVVNPQSPPNYHIVIY